MNALEIKGLCKQYKGFQLGPLDLTLPEGCVVGLVGENGAGKSTTIKSVLGAVRFDSGCVKALGKDCVTNAAALKEDIGVVFDELGLHEFMTVRDVDRMMKCFYRRWDRARFYGLVRELSIPEAKQIKEYSRGMKMKLGLAVALSHDPKLLLLDEATSGLDPVARDHVMDMLNDFTRDEHHSVLISSHIVSDLEKICDYIAFLRDGKLIFFDEKDRIRERYALVRCSQPVFDAIDPSLVIGARRSSFGVEAIVQKQAVNEDMEQGIPDIEQLFVFMAKEGN